MPKISFHGQDYACEKHETVLDGLTRHGVSIPSSCRSGVCQCCMMQAVVGTPSSESQAGLKESLRRQNYFLACVNKPEHDMEVALPGETVLQKINAEVTHKEKLNDRIIRLKLRPQQSFDYRPGQFVQVYRPDGLSRSYSIANTPRHNGLIELHVMRIKDGKMSGWLHEQLQPGDTVQVSTALGDCVYQPENPALGLLMIATGCGLAPLWGILQEALDHGHHGPIHLFHGSRNAEGLYLTDELQNLTGRHPNFIYTPCISGSDVPEGYVAGRANDIAMTRLRNLRGWKIYLCGNPDMVKEVKKKSFLAGAAMKDIYSDAFVLQKHPAPQVGLQPLA